MGTLKDQGQLANLFIDLVKHIDAEHKRLVPELYL